jgi:hypothetical protein
MYLSQDTFYGYPSFPYLIYLKHIYDSYLLLL